MKRMAFLLVFAAGAAQAQTAPAPQGDAVQEIVVIGQKLKAWKGGVTKEHGRLVCRTKQSSGDRQVDGIRCGAMLTCVKPLEPEIDTLMASDASMTEKRDRFDAMIAGTKPCLEKYEAAAVARLAAERARL